jgi:hypothetical protein
MPILLYIDPGAGSMVFQALIAGALASVFFFRTTIARGIGWFRRNNDSSETRDGAESSDK